MSAHNNGNPLDRSHLPQLFLDLLSGSNVSQQPTNHSDVLCYVYAQMLIRDANACVVKSKIIERFAQIRDTSSQSHSGPKLPVAADPQTFVRASHFFVDGPAKNNGTRIWDYVRAYEIVPTLLAPVNNEIRSPSVRREVTQIAIGKTVTLIFCVYAPRQAVCKRRFRLMLKHGYHPLQHPLAGIVVRFSNPDVLAAREPDAFVPLFEGAAR